MKTSLDASEVKELAELFAPIGRAAPGEARKVVAKGCLNIKTDAKERVQGLKHAPAYPRAITYDTHLTPTGARGEVGPDKNKRQGALGNLLEFGSVNNEPKPHIAPAAATEKPKFEKAMETLGADLLEPVAT